VCVCVCVSVDVLSRDVWFWVWICSSEHIGRETYLCARAEYTGAFVGVCKVHVSGARFIRISVK